MKHLNLRGSSALGRGLLAVRAEAQPKKPASIEALATLFEEFKATHQQQLTSKVDDTLLDQKLEAISTELSNVEAALSEKIAASAVGSGVGDIAKTNPDYVKGFKAYMRKGIDLAPEITASIDIGTPADGGYFAPVEWDRSVTEKLKQLSPIRQNSQVIQITTNGFSRVYSDGIIGSGWVGETAARPATTTPGLSTLAFNTGEIYANPQITQIALDDVAIDLEQWIADEVDREFAIQENIAFLSGNGTNKPTGILNYVTGGANAATHPFGAITGATVAGTGAVTTDELLTLIYSLPSERNGNAKFYLNRGSLGALRKLKDTTNNYIWQPTFQAGEPSTLAGYPVVEVPGMPAMTTGLVSILFGDMEATYLVIDRVGLRVLRDPYTNKPFVGFYTTKRVGGGVQNPEYMRYIKQA